MDLSSLVQTAFGQAFEHYRAFNESNPITGSILTAGAVFPAADVASQLLANKTVEWRKVRYSAGLSLLYGVLAHGCVRSADLVGAYLSDHALAKAALGPNLWGNFFNVFFFINNSVGEKQNYRFSSLLEHYASTLSSVAGGKSMSTTIQEKILNYVPAREYLYATLGTLTFWNAFQYLNYSYIPKELQTPATLGVAFGWTVLLSFWSLMGRRKPSEK